MKKFYCITFALVLLSTVAVVAQPHFNDEQGNLNYRGNELLINPATLGATDSYRIGLGFNKLWTGIESSPMAGQLQFQMPVTANNGLGAWVYSENYGPQTNVQFGAAFGHSLRIGDNRLALGLSLSLLMMNEKQVTGDNPNDPVFATSAGNQMGFNAGFGAYYFGENFYAGFSIPQLLTNDFKANGTILKLKNSLAFDRLQYYLTGGYRFAVGEKIGLMPAALLEFSGKTDLGYEVMLTADYNRFLEVGAGFAAQSCLKIAAGVNITKNIGLRYQFAQHLGNDYKNFGSSHFITLWLNWGGKKVTVKTPEIVQ